MKQFVKTLAAMLLIALCLTSDTAQCASQFQGSRFKVQVSAKRCSMNSVASVATGQRLPYWENRSCLRQAQARGVTPPCGYPLP